MNMHASPESHSPELRAAIRVWEQLAAFAWNQFEQHGRGLLLLDGEELRAAGISSDHQPPLQPSYVPEAIVPAGDDFLPLLRTYDPARQVLLLTTRADGEEMLLCLESAGDVRPVPQVCSRRARSE